MTTFPPQPPIGAPGQWSFPLPSTSTLSNGIELLTFDQPGQHVIAAHLVLDLPLGTEPRELEGVATLTARTLDEGTRKHGGEEFAELLETEGAGFGIDLSLSGTQAVLDVPATRLDRALELFAEAVREPALADEDVNRHVTLRLAEIEQSEANSAQLASIAFRRAVFDPESRGARMNGGEPDTVGGITPDEVRAFHARHYGPHGATLILAGDFSSTGDPVALAERCFGDWTNPGQAPVQHLPIGPARRQVQIIHRPGAVQADIRLGGYAIDRFDPRWPAITVASYAMGGAFLSRLNAVLREDLGYTYGIRLAFSPLRSGGSFAVQGSFRTEVVGDTLHRLHGLLDVSEKPFTNAEVADAVTYFTGVSPLRYATADGVADQAATHVLAGLPHTYVDSNLDALRAVTPDDATTAYAELVDLNALTLVVVGDADLLAEPIRAAGHPDLEVIVRD